MTQDGDFPLEGGCTCHQVRYRMTTRPLFVHCCHCRWCQRETGASFAGDAVRFVRVGTLDEPDRLAPDIHIFTASKQPWVVLPPGVPAVAEYYKSSELWPKESLERRAALLAKRS